MSKELFENQKQLEEIQSPQYSLKNISLYFNKLAESVENGDSDSMITLSRLSAVEKAIKECKDKVYQTALTDAEKYPEKSFTYEGLTVEKRNGRKIYNFKEIEEWNDIKSQLTKKEIMYKAAFDAWQKGLKVFDEETGEEIPIPIVTTTRDVLVIKESK